MIDPRRPSQSRDDISAAAFWAAFASLFIFFERFPDLDIALFGIGAHRNFLFHSGAIVAVFHVMRDKARGAPVGTTGRRGLVLVSDLLLLTAGAGVGVHLIVDATIQSGKAVLFPLIGSLVNGTRVDDRLWLAANGLFALALARGAWNAEFERQRIAGLSAVKRLAERWGG